MNKSIIKELQYGSMLLEQLVAVALSGFLLLTLNHFFLQGQQYLVVQSKQVMLQQNTQSVMSILKNELKRAGYAGELQQTLSVIGAEHSLFTLQETNQALIGYVYFAQHTNGQNFYKNAIYERRAKQPDSLYLCEREVDFIMDTTAAKNFASAVGNTCNNLFDPKLIQVTDFNIQVTPLIDLVSQAKNLWVEVSLSTQWIDDPQIKTTHSFSLKLRHWL